MQPGIEQEFESAIEAKRVDSGENVIVLLPDDPGVFYMAEGGVNRLSCTNPVQTYVDLCTQALGVRRPRRRFWGNG
jgi:hypothetical protein